MHQRAELRRLSPFPPPGSPELLRIHAEMQAALDRKEESKISRSQRVELAQSLRRFAVRLDP